MKKIAALGAVVVLLSGLFVYGGIFAKKLPTNKVLEDRLMGIKEGFELAVYNSQKDIPTERIVEYQKCMQKSENEIKETLQLYNELVYIYQYYVAVDGSEEALDNFDKWQKDFESKYPKVIKEIESCHTKSTQGIGSI